MNSDYILQVRDLKVGFEMDRATVEVLRGVSFDVKRGHTLGIVGESGCGKSVTVHSILQLLPKQGKILSGEALYAKNSDSSTNLSKLKKNGREMRAIRGKEIGIIFQDPMASLNPVYTVGAQIIENLMEHNPQISKKDALARGVQMLEKLGIPDAKNRIKDYPHQFSGGMKQRVMIAIAMICDPNLLIADEPTTALDVTIQAQIMHLMKQIQLQDHKSIILITHNMGLVAEMADEIAVMYMGKVVETGTVAEIFNNPLHPYTKALLKSVPVLGMDRSKRLSTIRGMTPSPDEVGVGCAFAPRCDEAQEKCMQFVHPVQMEAEHCVTCTLYQEKGGHEQ